MIAINVQAGGPRLILVMMLQEKKVIAMATVMDIADLFNKDRDQECVLAGMFLQFADIRMTNLLPFWY
jgi:hypothetical protein